MWTVNGKVKIKIRQHLRHKIVADDCASPQHRIKTAGPHMIDHLSKTITDGGQKRRKGKHPVLISKLKSPRQVQPHAGGHQDNPKHRDADVFAPHRSTGLRRNGRLRQKTDSPPDEWREKNRQKHIKPHENASKTQRHFRIAVGPHFPVKGRIHIGMMPHVNFAIDRIRDQQNAADRPRDQNFHCLVETQIPVNNFVRQTTDAKPRKRQERYPDGTSREIGGSVVCHPPILAKTGAERKCKKSGNRFCGHHVFEKTGKPDRLLCNGLGVSSSPHRIEAGGRAKPHATSFTSTRLSILLNASCHSIAIAGAKRTINVRQQPRCPRPPQLLNRFGA